MKKLNVRIMTKQVADTLAKENAVREKKVERGVAVKRGEARTKKGK